ncbi:hypothetical protein CYMTET_52360 [Cymbomonas tetramitiformis]|uniref:Uncharacterized protein n=1 Tax=Cymbomonas tetramitiformis TaxID=36881 RepID=A0AAE0ER63_9CHLO|nr:hypothetical protein CYMTET_52360 [Cymbomonas tetramitiformis]
MVDAGLEDAIEQTGYATQDGHGGGMQGSGHVTQLGQTGQVSGGAGEAGKTTSRLLESMEDAWREAENLPAVEGRGLRTTATALAEEGVANLMGASKRGIQLLEKNVGTGGAGEEGDERGAGGRVAGGVDACRAPQDWGPVPAAMTTYDSGTPAVRRQCSCRGTQGLGIFGSEDEGAFGQNAASTPNPSVDDGRKELDEPLLLGSGLWAGGAGSQLGQLLFERLSEAADMVTADLWEIRHGETRRLWGCSALWQEHWLIDRFEIVGCVRGVLEYKHIHWFMFVERTDL